jgi:hypothetical protein
MLRSLPSLCAVAVLVGCAAESAPRPTAGDHVPERTLGGAAIQEQFRLEDGLLVSDVLEGEATRVGLFLDVASDRADHVLAIEARGVRADGSTTAWRPAVFTWAEHPLRVGRVDLGAVVSGVQVRMPIDDAAALVGLTFSAVVPEPARPAPALDADTAKVAQQALDIAGVKSRADWGARATECSSLNTTKTKISVHHTVTPSDQGGSLSTFAQRIRGIQAFHMDSNGWCDIGYTFMVTIDGTTWEAREAKYLGAHVANNNTNNVGVSFIGCFHTSSCGDYPPNAPPQAMLDGGGALIGKIADRYGITISGTTVIGHRDNPDQSTSCPGDNLHDELPTLRTIAQDGAATTPTTGKVQGVVWDLGVTTDATQSEAMGARLPGAVVSRSGAAATSTARDGDAYWSFDLAPGTYTFTATMDGYAPASREVQVTAGASLWASIGVAPEPQAASLTILVFDASAGVSAPIQSAEVSVTGADPAQTGADGKAAFSVAAGTITVQATAEGYEPGTMEESIAAGSTRTLQLGLVPVVVDEPGDPEDPVDPPEDPVDPPDDEEEEEDVPLQPEQAQLERVVIPADPGVAGGCTSTGGTSLAGLAALTLLLRRRRGPRAASPSCGG